jgi:hypothetical protein
LLPDPLHDEAIRGEKADAVRIFNRLQRPYPGIELLRGKFAFEPIQTCFPQ